MATLPPFHLAFPVTDLVGGLQSAGGFPSLVRIERVTG